MTIWQPNLAGRHGPKYLQIAEAIGEDAAAGRLPSGTRLPPQRELAYLLGVSLQTVSRAYAEAMERGFLKGEVGRGTYVRDGSALTVELPSASLIRSESGPIDFSLNLPAPSPAAEALACSLAKLSGADDLASLLDYQVPGELAPGTARTTEAAIEILGRIGLAARGENIVLTCGAQHGLLVALMACTRPGDVLLTEALTYAPITAMAQRLGLKVVPLASDHETLCPDALDAACGRVAAEAFYCLPTLHTPTTATLDAERRAAVAAVARKHDLTLIEDDVFGFLPPKRPLPLACFAPERTLYVTSVSKSLAPGLRIGFLHAPRALTHAAQTAVSLSSWMPPPLMAEIASGWLEDGTAERLNAFQREEAAARQALARVRLPAELMRADPHGFHVWLTLPVRWNPEVFRMVAEARGVKLLAGAAFAVDPARTPNAVRLCLSHESSRARVEQGLAIVAELLQEESGGSALVL